MVNPTPRLTRLTLLLAVVLAGDGRIDTGSLIERAQSYQAQGRIDAAVTELRGALQRDPNNAAARDMMVRVYVDRAAELRQAGDRVGAVAELESGLHWDRDSTAVRDLLVRDYVALGNARAGFSQFD